MGLYRYTTTIIYTKILYNQDRWIYIKKTRNYALISIVLFLGSSFYLSTVNADATFTTTGNATKGDYDWYSFQYDGVKFTFNTTIAPTVEIDFYIGSSMTEDLSITAWKTGYGLGGGHHSITTGGASGIKYVGIHCANGSGSYIISTNILLTVATPGGAISGFSAILVCGLLATGIFLGLSRMRKLYSTSI